MSMRPTVREKRPLPGNAFEPAIVKHGCTYRVHQVLLAQHPAYLSHGDIRNKTGLGRGAVSWALRYLLEHRAIELMAHPRRVGYYRYRAVLEVNQ
jgi:DNA-binding transcriptional ArsR family regulator